MMLLFVGIAVGTATVDAATNTCGCHTGAAPLSTCPGMTAGMNVDTVAGATSTGAGAGTGAGGSPVCATEAQLRLGGPAGAADTTDGGAAGAAGISPGAP